MRIRRDRTYRLFRETKTSALSITTSLIMILSSIGGASPLLFTHGVSAEPILSSAPTGVHFVHGSSSLSSGSVLNYTDGSLDLVWNTAAGIDRYDVVVAQPNGITLDYQPSTWSPLPSTMSFELNRPVANGNFGLAGQGVYSYTVRSRNATTGQWSEFSAPVTLGYDTEKPTVAFTSLTPANNAHVNGSFTVGYAANDNVELKSVTVGLYDNNAPNSWKWLTTCYQNGTEMVAADSGTCTVHLPSGLADGSYTLQVGAQDQAGNWSVNADRTIIVDHSAPTGFKFVKDGTSTVVPTGSAINYHNVTLSWTPINPLGTKGDRYRVEIVAPNGDRSSADTGWDTYGLDYSANHGFFGTQQGTWTYQVEYQNPYTGIWTDLSGPMQLTYDDVRPVAQVTQGPSEWVNGDFPVTATVTDDLALNDSSLVLQVEDLTTNARAAKCVSNTLTISFNANNTQATLHCTIDTSTLQEGHVYYVWAWGADTAGNSSSNVKGQSMVAFTVDRTAPMLTINSPAVNDVASGKVTVSGTATDNGSGVTGQQVTLHLRSVKSNGKLDGFLNTFTATVKADGTWSTTLDTSAFPDGQYGITALVNDVAGNSQSQSGGTSVKPFTVDNTLVSATSVGGLGGGLVVNNVQNSAKISTQQVATTVKPTPSQQSTSSVSSTGAVLGDKTTTPNTDESTGAKGESAKLAADTLNKNSGFLSSSWGWLVGLAFVIGVFLAISLKRRETTGDK